LSPKPQQGASAKGGEPFGVTATAADEAGTKVKSRQDVRPPSASESQILRELALKAHFKAKLVIDNCVFEEINHFRGNETRL
jgi:hypothetical protein